MHSDYRIYDSNSLFLAESKISFDKMEGTIYELRIKDGCDVKQLGLSWQDQLHFVLADDLSLHNIRFQDELREQVKEMEPETAQQRFDADFLIMTETLSGLLKELLNLFIKLGEPVKAGATSEMAAVN